MATWYRTDDAGFPTLTGTTFNMYKIILKATLVEGYGGKAPAGWTLVDESDSHIVLRNTSGGHITLVQHSVAISGGSAYAVKIYLSATYTGMSSNVPQGLGVTSGANGLAAANHIWGHQFAFTYKNVPTTVVADDKSCVLQAICSAWSLPTTKTGLETDTQASAALCFGDDTTGRFVAIGGYHIGGASAGYYGGSFTGISALINPLTAALIGSTSAVLRHSMQCFSASAVISTSGTILDSIVPTLSAEDLTLTPVLWSCDGAYGGALRGVAFEAQLLCAGSHAVRNLLHGDGLAVSGIHMGNITTPAIIGGNKYAAMPCGTSYRLGGLIMTDAPEAWSWSPA